MIPEIGTIGFSPIRETIKTIYIRFNDFFLEKYGLEYAASMADLESRSTIVMLPLIKPSYGIIGQNIFMSDKVCKEAILNIFEEIVLTMRENQ